MALAPHPGIPAALAPSPARLPWTPSFAPELESVLRQLQTHETQLEARKRSIEEYASLVRAGELQCTTRQLGEGRSVWALPTVGLPPPCGMHVTTAQRADASPPLPLAQGKAAALAEATQRLEELKSRQEELEREKRVRALSCGALPVQQHQWVVGTYGLSVLPLCERRACVAAPSTLVLLCPL